MATSRLRIVAQQLNDGVPGAPVVVFGPAPGVSVRSLWAPVVAVLGDRCRAVGWDLPGHGASPPSVGAFALGDLAGAVWGALEGSVGPPGPARRLHYVGSSIGALVGLVLAAGSDLFESMVVTSVGTVVDDRGAWSARGREARSCGMGAIARGSSERWFGPTFRAAHPDRTHALVRDLASVDPGSYASCCDVMATFDIDDCGDSGRPISGVWGELDRQAPPNCADGLRALRPALLEHTVAGASHMVPVERPGTVAHIVARSCLAPGESGEEAVGPPAGRVPLRGTSVPHAVGAPSVIGGARSRADRSIMDLELFTGWT